MTIKICSICQKPKDTAEFYLGRKKCIECFQNAHKEYMLKKDPNVKFTGRQNASKRKALIGTVPKYILKKEEEEKKPVEVLTNPRIVIIIYNDVCKFK